MHWTGHFQSGDENIKINFMWPMVKNIIFEIWRKIWGLVFLPFSPLKNWMQGWQLVVCILTSSDLDRNLIKSGESLLLSSPGHCSEWYNGEIKVINHPASQILMYTGRLVWPPLSEAKTIFAVWPSVLPPSPCVLSGDYSPLSSCRWLKPKLWAA